MSSLSTRRNPTSQKRYHNVSQLHIILCTNKYPMSPLRTFLRGHVAVVTELPILGRLHALVPEVLCRLYLDGCRMHNIVACPHQYEALIISKHWGIDVLCTLYYVLFKVWG